MAKKKAKKEEIIEEKKISKKEQIKTENNILKIFVAIIIVIFVLLGLLMLSNHKGSEKEFDYKGINFTILDFGQKNCDNCLYYTEFPYILKRSPAIHKMWFKYDPRDLDKISFEGELKFEGELLLYTNFSRRCNSGELKNLDPVLDDFFDFYETVLGIRVSPQQGNFEEYEDHVMYLFIQESDKSYIEQIGPSRYRINVGNCEIAQGIERFLLETLVVARKKD